MSWITALIMLLGLLLAHALFRDWKNPGILFASAWFVGCLLVALVGDVTYGISLAAGLVFFGTVLLFNLGVLFGLGGRRVNSSFNAPDWLRSRDLSLIISAGAVLVAVLTPLFLIQGPGISGLDDVSLRLVTARSEQVALSGTTGTFSLLNNLPVLAQVIAMLAAFTLERRWFAWARLLVIAACWIVLGLSTGSKMAAVQVPLTVMLCVIMTRSKIPLIGIAIAAVISIGVFTSGLIMINFGYLIHTGAMPDLDQLASVVASYFLGGLVGFSELLDQGLYAYWPQNVFRTVLYTLNAVSGALGLDDFVHIGYQHAPFISLGPAITGNVYTAVFSYYATGGWLGVLLWSVLAGLLCGWAYRGFYSGRTWALVAAPVFFYGIMGSIIAEQIFGGFLHMLKLLLIVGGIRISVELARRIRATAPRPVTGS